MERQNIRLYGAIMVFVMLSSGATVVVISDWSSDDNEIEEEKIIVP